jgi:hypothetical protein
MRRILLAVAGYAIAAWWNSRNEAKAEARAQSAVRDQRARRRSTQLQGHSGERRARST